MENTETVLREQIRKEIEQEFEQRFEIWKVGEFAEYAEKQDAVLEDKLRKYLEEMQNNQKPMSAEDIEKLLNQEYATFNVKLTVNSVEQTFVINELPQEVERTFYRQFYDQVKNKASDLAALEQATMDKPFEQKMLAFLSTFDGAFDILADATVLVLNHDKRFPEITREWCQKNLSSYRMWNIVRAQVEVNKLRNFFSELFQSGVRAQTMTSPANAQLLQQLQAR